MEKLACGQDGHHKSLLCVLPIAAVLFNSLSSSAVFRFVQRVSSVKEQNVLRQNYCGGGKKNLFGF